MYTILDPKIITELSFIKQGWFSPEYELADGLNSYGKVTFHRLTRRKATAESATGTWIFQRGDLFKREILIKDGNDGFIGKLTREWFSRRATLTLQTGFRADFYRPSIWSREYIWESAGYGKIMHFKNNPFSLKSTIYIDQSLTPATLIPLLTFFGTYLVILSRRRKARH